jgi:uncharacterized metal-binding protein YceD (DUF177 family)
MTTELAWDYPTHDIPDSGFAAERDADADELKGVARALDLNSCNRLAAAFKIVRGSGERYVLSGSLQAEVGQTCVVTLEPIVSRVEEAFEAEFWPENELPEPAGGELDLAEQIVPEPFANGLIPVGRIVFETLAGAIDPFPRKPDATLDWQPSADAEARSGRANPFAVLAKLKEKS